MYLNKMATNNFDPTEYGATEFNPEQFGATPVETKQKENKPSVLGFLGNAVSSAGNAIKGMVGAVTHPIDTVTGLGQVAAGGVQEIPGVSQIFDNISKGGKDNSVLKSNREAFNNVVNFYAQRYGGKDAPEVLKNMAKTAYEDPVGMALDVSTLITGLGGATKSVGNLSKIEEVVNAGKAIGKVGEVINPINAGLKSVDKISELAGKGASKARNIAFGITTGKGSETALQAYQAGLQGGESGRLFLDTMRGKISKTDVVNNARDVLDSIVEKRGDAYRTGLAVIQEETKGKILPLDGIQNTSYRALDKIGVPNVEGKLDFSARPSLDAKTINKVVNTINTWEDNTPLGLNQLKQEIRGFEKGGINLSPADARFNTFIDSTVKNIDRLLKDNVNGYGELNAKYALDTEFIKDIRRDLLSRDPGAESTALNKLTSALKTDNNFKLDILDEIKNRTGVDLSKQIAGVNSSTFMPGGFIGRGIDIYQLIRGVSALVDPKTLLLMASTSPRVAGEFLYGLGFSKRMINPVLDTMRKIPSNELDVLSKALYYSEKTSPDSEGKK